MLADLKDLYDSYRFLPDVAEPLYNSRSYNFYLNYLMNHDGQILRETID